jgi:hypothetical protein
MSRKILTVSVCAVGGILLAGSIAIAQQSEKTKSAPGGHKEMPLPPGWTEADMQACTAAGTPGKMHKYLAKDVGVWQGETTMWMGPGTEPVSSECTSTVTSVLDGRFIHCEVSGEDAGMGPFHGFGIYGFDNVTQRFVSAWVDNCGTGIMNGTGELSSDGKVMTWEYNYTCPITRKPTVMREVETATGPNSKTFEIFGADPKSGKEYKMLSIEYTRKP